MFFNYIRRCFFRSHPESPSGHSGCLLGGKRSKQGFSLIEVLVSLGVFSLVIFSVAQVFIISKEARKIGEKKIQAEALSLEYLEGLKNIRHSGWVNLTNGRFILNIDGGNLTLEPTEEGEVINGFTRYLEIEDAYRDETGKLVDEGGTLDPSTKKINVFVSWESLRPGSLQQTTYLTRYLENLVWKQTTVSDFEAGEMEMVKIVDPVQDDGELQLMGGCPSGSPESLIYDDELRNGWRTDCRGLPFWQWLFCRLLQFFSNGEIDTDSTDYTYDNSAYSMKIKLKPPYWGGFWSWVRLYNYDGVCTVGFRNLRFFAYNPSSEEIDFWVTAVYQEWDKRHVVLPPGGWTEINIDYEEINEDYEKNLESIYFSRFMWAGQSPVVFYIDQMELTGGVGGYFTEGTFISETLDTEASTAFNRISFSGFIPQETQIGFQIATSNDPEGPWNFIGPEGTGLSDDLYLNPDGEGILLGANIGRYFRFKAYLKSFDGQDTPILYDVTINYSP